MNRFLLEIIKKYTKIVKSANLIGFLNQLAVSFNLTDSRPLDITSLGNGCKKQKYSHTEPTNVNSFYHLAKTNRKTLTSWVRTTQ